jgi:hypothetical protein
MPIKQTFQFDNSSITIWEWSKTLPEVEQQEFKDSERRQHAFRDRAIAEGLMQKVGDNYIWRDEEAKQINKPHDPVWFKYWERYLQETGTEFSIKEEKI